MGNAAVNALLTRYSQGFMEIQNGASVTALGRIEGFLSLGQITDPSQATLAANAQLALSAQEQLTITAEIEPSATYPQVPYTDFDLGDQVTVPTEDATSTTLERVVSFTIAEDTEGNPIYRAELNQPCVVAEQRWNQWLTQMQAGTLAGTATSATPVQTPAPPAPPVPDEIITWDQPAADPTGSPILLASGMSNALPVNKTGILYKVVVVLQGPSPGFGTGPTILTVYVNGMSIGTVTVPVGIQTVPGYFSKQVNAIAGATPDLVSVDFTTVDGVATGAHVMVSVH